MPDQSIVCTLFEGHYHFGVAALVNSLHKQGFRGDVYAGYRGLLPKWTDLPACNEQVNWKGGQSFQVTSDFRLHFLPIETNYHFTNFKPDFMLLIWSIVAENTNQIFYFDPDIVLVAPWEFLREWVTCGVALCEDVNSPLSENHPRRVAWRRYFSNNEITLKFRNAIYVNGGFIGVESKGFLQLWQKIQNLMAFKIGGLNRSSLTGESLLESNQGPFAPFGKTDQDALNATIEAWEGNVSFMGKEAMAFSAGTLMMPHALGQPKPWHWQPFIQSIHGLPPRQVDRAYWNAVNGVIKSQPYYRVFIKKITLNIAAFIGRFYRRGPL